MTQENIIHIYDDQGSSAKYKLVSARLAAFLEQWGPEKGFQIESSSQDYLTYTKGRLALSIALAEQGNLPPEKVDELLNNQRVLFQCRLMKDGAVIAEASAIKHVTLYKDHETGETAAFQRLMAKLGHGGEIFDNDEANDMLDQKIKTITPNQPSEVLPDIAKESVNDEDPQSTDEDNSKQEEQSAPTTKVAGVVRPKRKDATTKPDKTIVQPGQLRSLQAMAKAKKVPCPTVETPEELKRELTRLRGLPIPA